VFGLNCVAIALATNIDDRFAQSQLGAAAVEHPPRGEQHVERPVAHWKDLAGFFDLGRDAFGLEHGDQFVRPQGRQRRVEKRALLAEGFDDAACVGGVRKVAPRAAGHEDLHARLAILLQ
jgi:hypothetical protein